MNTPRHIFALYLALVVVAVANCDSIPENNFDTASIGTNHPEYDYTDEDENYGSNNLDQSRMSEYEAVPRDYVDNQTDAVPTYMTPAEKFLKTIISPLGWITHPSDSGREYEPQSGLGKLISGITKPIRDIVKPVEKIAQGSFGEVLNIMGDRFKAIYPGTEWCGAGDAASNSEEVGLFQNTDRCCRGHDHCTMNMEAGSTDHGLKNNGMFTRSHCECDSEFYNCLKQVRSLISSKIGFTYFNVLRPQCFKYEYPAVCVRFGRTRLTNNKCLEYAYDVNQEKKWQWFDSPDF